MVVVDEKVADHGCYGETGESEDVGDGVDVFVSWEGDAREDFGFGFLGLLLFGGWSCC